MTKKRAGNRNAHQTRVVVVGLVDGELAAASSRLKQDDNSRCFVNGNVAPKWGTRIDKILLGTEVNRLAEVDGNRLEFIYRL